MGRFSSLGRPVSALKKQISIESSIERTVEDDAGGEERDESTQLGSSVSVTISRVNDGMGRLPKPSSSAADPLNWPRWKTELVFASFLSLASASSFLKLILAPVNAVLSSEFDASYFDIVCLTGVPILLGAVTSLGSAVLGRFLGRRLVLVFGAFLMFGAVMGNMRVGTNYTQFMVARVFQGIGWGLVDGALADSVGDLFFYRQQPLRTNVLNLTKTLFTWSAPILSGRISQNRSWRTVFTLIGMSQGISLLFLVFFAPETRVDRSHVDEPEARPSHQRAPSSLSGLEGTTSTIITSSSTIPPSSFKLYLSSLRFPKPTHPQSRLLPVKALIAPSTIVAFLLAGPLTAAAYGLSSSVALLFSIAPTLLKPKRIGYIFILPASFVLCCHLVHAAFSRLSSIRTSSRPKSRTISTLAIVQYLILGAGGVVGLGLYTCAKLGPRMVRSSEVVSVVDGEMMNESRLWVVGALLGAAVAGAVGVRIAALAHASTSAFGTSRSGGESEVEVSRLISSAMQVYITVLSGIFTLAFPNWVASLGHSVPSQSGGTRAVSSSSSGPWKRHGEETISTVKAVVESPTQLDMGMLMGIQITSVAVAIVILVVGGVAAMALVFGGEGLRKRDRKVLGFVGGRSEGSIKDNVAVVEMD